MNDDKEIANGAQLSLHLVLQESPDIDPNGLRYANDKASAVHASIQHMNRLVDGSRPLASISETSDSGIAIATTAQGIYENTQATGSCVQHLGRALQSLEQVVKVVDGIAEVSRLLGIRMPSIQLHFCF
jgi:methyl-accepting chemotaxis protein